MRFELQKTWDINLRLKNWASRDKNFTGQIEEPKRISHDEHLRREEKRRNERVG